MKLSKILCAAVMSSCLVVPSFSYDDGGFGAPAKKSRGIFSAVKRSARHTVRGAMGCTRKLLDEIKRTKTVACNPRSEIGKLVRSKCPSQKMFSVCTKQGGAAHYGGGMGGGMDDEGGEDDMME